MQEIEEKIFKELVKYLYLLKRFKPYTIFKFIRLSRQKIDKIISEIK